MAGEERVGGVTGAVATGGAARPGEPADGADLRAALAARTGTRAEDWYLTFKARQAMKVVFDAVAACDAGSACQLAGASEPATGGNPAPGEVVTQLYTCCTAVDPIVAAGLVPVYGDIDARTCALDPRTLPLTARARVVVLQHTYGILDPKTDAALRSAAHGAGALLLEDCAHCVGRLSYDAAGQPIADVSVHSFGVEKMLPTHFGGAVWVSPEMPDAALRSDIVRRLEALPALDARLARAARRYRNQIRVLNHLPHGLSHTLRERLAAMGLFEPAIADVELAGGLASMPQAPDGWVVAGAAQAVAALDANEAQRSAAVAAYTKAFAELGTDVVRAPRLLATDPTSVQPLLRYPVFLDSAERADAAVAAVLQAGYYAVAWYRHLLFPGVPDPSAYAWDGSLEHLPRTRDNAATVACLPTDVSPEAARRIAQIVGDA